jgi:hypothetical protein
LIVVACASKFLCAETKLDFMNKLSLLTEKDEEFQMLLEVAEEYSKQKGIITQEEYEKRIKEKVNVK